MGSRAIQAATQFTMFYKSQAIFANFYADR
jgi:hypothetical protein